LLDYTVTAYKENVLLVKKITLKFGFSVALNVKEVMSTDAYPRVADPNCMTITGVLGLAKLI